MTDGTLRRITYAAKSGQRFTGPGRILAELGEIPLADVTMQSIRRWFRDNPGRIDEILWQNRSFIFFRDAPVDDPALGPIAAAKVPLTPGRSMAVDRLLHTFGTPFLHRRAVADGVRRKAVSPPDDRPGYRLGDHRAGARRSFCRIGRCGRRDCRRRAASGRFLRAGAARRWPKGSPHDAGGRKAQRRGSHHLDQGCAHGQPLKGKPPLPADEPQTGNAGAMEAQLGRSAGDLGGSPSRNDRIASQGLARIPSTSRPATSSPRAGCRSTPASICMA